MDVELGKQPFVREAVIGANDTTAFAPLPLLPFCLLHCHFHFHTCRICYRGPFPIAIKVFVREHSWQPVVSKSSPPLEDLPGFALLYSFF